MIRFSQLLNFVETVDRGSFSAAARSLYVSQSALSQSVAGLEEDLGAELIRRTRNGVRPTYFGHLVYGEAKGLITSFRRFETEIRGLLSERGELRGQVRIQCTPGAEVYLSETAIPEIRSAFPGIELVLLPTTDMRRGLESFLSSGGQLGIGACLDDSWEELRDAAGKAGMVCEFFGRERPRVLLGSRNPLAGEKALSREQLSGLDLVYYTFDRAPRYLPLFRGSAARMPNKESVVRLIAGSDSAGVFAPSSIRREMSELRGRVRLLPLDFEDEAFVPVVHYLIHKPEEELGREEQCVLQLIRFYPYTES